MAAPIGRTTVALVLGVFALVTGATSFGMVVHRVGAEVGGQSEQPAQTRALSYLLWRGPSPSRVSVTIGLGRIGCG